ncbi:hypothetical protein [Cardiobacterium hominis]|uniref:hypothetical protein n=1 Tax=Cardiobacterium hominis TaxID=2718 RepID=UPI00205374FC|nr:hypothetical protein [Cardiobacterium hominis]DAS85507.1 MAG TPA: hypothetical protein [Caudoviricetes sp.]
MAKRRTELTQQDLRIYPTEDLTDSDNGGGLMTRDPLTGADNELFNPVSDQDRTIGRFNARSVHAAVRVPSRAKLGGAHVIISKPAKAANVSHLLYRGVRYGERRKDIIKRIAAYAVYTIESKMTLLSTQSLGSRIVQAYQRTDEALPLVGDVYCLRQTKKGYPTEEQYIQVIRVSSENRTFTTPDGKDFVRTVVKMETSTALTADFIGADYPSITHADPPCLLMETHISDSASYYGVKPLVETIRANTQTIRVPSIMEKLVPTSQIETPLIDYTAAGQRQLIFDAARGESVLTAYNAINDSTVLHAGNAITPGSLRLTVEGITISDRGGTLYRGDTAVGTVDYARGELRFSETLSSGGVWTLYFRPAAELLQVADTASIPVLINNRSYNYVLTILPVPAPGSLQVSYRAQGRWYDLRDDGSGALRGGSAGHGSGSLNYRTGSVSITCGEMPDVGSEVLFSWGTQATVHNRADSQPAASMLIATEAGLAPNTVKLSWTDNGAKTAQDDGQGNITGAWTGTVDYRSGDITLSSYPGGEQRLDVKVDYSVGQPQTAEWKAPVRDGSGYVNLTLGQTQIKPRSVELVYNVLIEDYDRKVQQGEAYTRKVDPYVTVRDDGNGNLKDAGGTVHGSINYATGVIKLKPDGIVKIPKPIYRKEPMGEEIVSTQGTTQTVKPLYRLILEGYEYVPALASAPIDDSFKVTATYRGAQSEDARTKQATSGVLRIDLLPTLSEQIVPGSVRFAIGGEVYFDRRGELYWRLDTSSGAATRIGSIDYQSGIATVEQAPAGTLTLQALAGTVSANPVDAAVWRIPSAPVSPGSVQITATPLTGGQINVRADNGGKITGKGVEGQVDYESGVVRLRFGKLVAAAGNEAAYWYNPDAVDSNGKIWQPLPVYADSIRYNAVSYTYLPLDTGTIGIDPVRLPSDGRVPIYRRGDMIVIGHRLEEDIGSAHTAGQTVQLSRGDVDSICLRDAKGVPIEAKWYDYDLERGTITWASPLDLSAYTLPITAGHAREEENRLIAVDIDGTLQLQFATGRDYPADETYISSALIGGDLQVRATAPFGQKSWTRVWSDERIGDDISARLNVKDYPIQLADDGATTDRWAVVWRDGTQFDLYSEALGLVTRTDALQDLAPINPASGKPYFTLPKGAFGVAAGASGWQAGEVVRFNTFGTHLGVWVLRAIQPSAQRQTEDDGFTMCLRGNTTEI